MAATSISISYGKPGFTMSDFTIGTSAPGVGDLEVRFQNLDTNSKNVSDYQLVLLLKAIIRQLENGGASNINLILRTGTTPPPPLV